MNQNNRMESSETNLRLYVNLPYAKSTTNQQGGSIILKAVPEQQASHLEKHKVRSLAHS